MPSFAHITLVGHLGQDIEVKFLADGTPVGKFSVAVSTGRKDKKATSWYRITLWGKAAQSIQQYLTRGRAVLVHGEPSIREWTSSDGRKMISVEVSAQDVRLLGDKPESTGDQPATDSQPDPSQSDIPF